MIEAAQVERGTMEFRVLNYFLTIAREENITRAAAILHVSQPTLSRQIMQLEEELGVKLFTRSNHNIVLTEDGMLLKRRAQEILSLADRTRQDLIRKKEEISGEVAIGSGEFSSTSLFADQVSGFHKKYPRVRFRIYSGNADNIRDYIERGLLDFGIVMEPVDIGRYDCLFFPVKERWGVLLREELELAKKEQIVPADLAGVQLITGAGEMVRNSLHSWMGEHYDENRIMVTGNLLYNEAMMAKSGMGAVICLQLDCAYQGLRFVPLSPAIESKTALIWKKDQILSPAVGEFLRYVREGWGDLNT